MVNEANPALPKHLTLTRPSDWVMRFLPLVAAGGRVLDLACGGGRHGRAFLGAGYTVVLVDKDCQAVGDLAGNPKAQILTADLEDGSPWPLRGETFDAVCVVNYLHRPLFPVLIDSLRPGGVLIYETFARGNEAFARPRNPDHLLRAGELLEWVSGRLQVVAFEHGIRTDGPLPGVIQRIAAVRDPETTNRDDGEPEPHPLTPEIHPTKTGPD
ncbi:MAG: class I SAM-dependent methyltransferase [Rhodospirillales bacterium]